MGRGAVLGKLHARLSAVQRGCMMLLYAAGSGLGRVVEFLNTISCLLGMGLESRALPVKIRAEDRTIPH